LRSLKTRIDRFLHHPVFEIVLMLAILTSVVLLVAEVAVGRDDPAHHLLDTTGHWLTIAFVVELSLRFWVAPRKRRFFRLYWLDILAVLPVFRAFRILRVLRLVRLFRVGVLFHHRLRSLSSSLAAGLSLQLGLIVNIGIVVLVGAVAIHFIEGQNNPDFDTIYKSLWWSFFTLIAGEPVKGEPMSDEGMLVMSFVVLGGLTMFAVFTGVVSAVMVRRLKVGMEDKELDVVDLSGHIVICGWNRAAPLVIKELQAAPDLKHLFIVVVSEMDDPLELELRGIDRSRVFLHKGDYTRIEILDEVRIERASQAILLADRSLPRSDQDRDARTVLAALTIEKLNPEIKTCAQLLDRSNNANLQVAGVEEVVIGNEVSGHLIATAVRDRGLVSLFTELLSVQVGNHVFKVSLPEDWADATFADACARAKKSCDALLVAVERPSDDGPKMLVNPASDLALSVGDQLVVLARDVPRL